MSSEQNPPAAIIQRLISHIDKGTVLDIGAGQGRNALFLGSKGFEVTAIESDATALVELQANAAAQELHVDIIHSDILSYTPNQSFDVVIASAILHFLTSKQEVDQAIEMMQSHTKPGGHNVVTVILDKEVNNPRPYLFQEGELREYYQNWNIVEYQEALSAPYWPIPAQPEQIRSYVARLIARKP